MSRAATWRMFTLGFLILSPSVRAEDLPKPTAHETRQIEGWTVKVDTRLLDPANEALGKRSLVLLQEHLRRINDVVAADRLEKLHAVTIWLDLNHGSLKTMQYHPSPEWLTSHGFASELAKCVHISDATRFADPLHQHTQPWCVLHELAHSYHDQMLGFDEPRIKAAWQKYKESGHGDSVLHVNGRMQRHYALTNQMEFFAEMSECYFGTNDFFPFVNGELKQAEPEIYALLREVWGPPAWEKPVLEKPVAAPPVQTP
jgi:hypothetical protein